MPAPKPSPARERAVVLGRTMGARRVAEQLEREGLGKVGKSAVAEWLRADRAHRAGAATAERPSKGRPVASSPGKKASKAAAHPEDPDEALDDDEGPAKKSRGLPAELEGVDLEALDHDELVKLDKQATKFLGEAFKAREERRWIPLARFKVELRTALAKLRPAPKVDPTTDPASLEARAAVLARIQKMIENARGASPPMAPPPPA